MSQEQERKYIRFCFCTPLTYIIDINEYTSWKDIKYTISTKWMIHPSFIKTLIYNNKIIIPNDDFVEPINNEILYVVLNCEQSSDYASFISQIASFTQVVNGYNVWRTRILLTIVYNLLYAGHPNEQLPNERHILTQEQITALKSLKFRDVGQLRIEKYSICPISQNEITDDTDVIILPCDHYFIKESILIWLSEYSDTCPTCRQLVFP